MGMADEDGAVEPAPSGGGGSGGDPEIDKLSNIIKTFNDLFGNVEWKDADKIRQSNRKGHPCPRRAGQGLSERPVPTPTNKTRSWSTTKP